MCPFTNSVTVSVKFNLYIMVLHIIIKINHEQSDKVTDAADFRGRRPSKDGMPVEGVAKILALLPLKMLIFLQFIPAKQGFYSSISLKFSRDARAEAASRQKEIFLVQVVLSL